MIVERRAVVTFPAEMARERCWPKTVRQIEDRHLRVALNRFAWKWIRTKAKEGYAFLDSDDIHVYGPFPTPERIAALLTEEDLAISKPGREQIVLERDSEPTAFGHYLMNANFVAQQGGSKGADEWLN